MTEVVIREAMHPKRIHQIRSTDAVVWRKWSILFNRWDFIKFDGSNLDTEQEPSTEPNPNYSVPLCLCYLCRY